MNQALIRDLLKDRSDLAESERSVFDRGISYALDALYWACDDRWISVLDDLMLESGLRWQCEASVAPGRGECRWLNGYERDSCERCGCQRREISVEATAEG